ncbi:MAG: phosphotransferase [Anaerolineae bacterium]|nr:phosphotransferase [Anaerolineae bacterium]
MAIYLNSVLSHYDIGEPYSARPVERGFVNEGWRIETPLGNYYLKHYHPNLCRPDIIRAQHALVAHLRQSEFPAPTILSTISGDTLLALGNELYEIQECIEGAFYDHGRPEHFQEAARTLGRYHACVKGFAPQALCSLGELYSPAILRANLIDLADAWKLDHDPEMAQVVRQLETHVDDLVARFATHGTLPHLVIHGDYYADNLLFEDDRIVGVVDYDKARWQPRVVELAETLIYFASPRPGHLQCLVYPGFLEWAPFERFLRHYASVVKLDESEIHALPDYIRCIWLQISLQRLSEKGPRLPEASEALGEVLALGEWAEANTRKMIETSKEMIRDA